MSRFILFRAAALILIVSLSVNVQAADVMTFAAPPTETAAEGNELYAPIVKLLSKHTGKKWRYERARDWLSYVKFIVGDEADATLSVAHFAGYLSLYHNHEVLVRSPFDVDWMLVGRAGSDFNVIGRSVCLIPPPEMGSLILTNHKAFSDPFRTPHVVSMTKREDLLSSLKSKRCAYTVLPNNMITNSDGSLQTRLLSKVPGPTITAGKNVDDKMANKIRQALLSEEGQQATHAIRASYLGDKQWVAPQNMQPYLLASTTLVQGYLVPMQRMDIAFKVVQQKAQRVAVSDSTEEWAKNVEPSLVPDIRAIRLLASNKILRDAVYEQNSKAVSLARIKELDNEWSSTKEMTPFKLALQESEAGTLLKQSVLLNPQYTELFLTDDQGANVAAYPATSDYWQGDEAKFSKSFAGAGRVFIGKQEFDESTKKVSVQVSVPIYSNDNRVIGVLVAGLVVDYLRWKQKQTVASMNNK